MTEDRPVVVYALGICCASVCARDDVPRDEIEATVNRMHPTGIPSEWQISEENFASGDPNPRPCNSGPGRAHYLLQC